MLWTFTTTVQPIALSNEKYRCYINIFYYYCVHSIPRARCQELLGASRAQCWTHLPTMCKHMCKLSLVCKSCQPLLVWSKWNACNLMLLSYYYRGLLIIHNNTWFTIVHGNIKISILWRKHEKADKEYNILHLNSKN